VTRLGADPHDLRGAATRLDAAAARLREVRVRTDHRIATTWWSGTDASRFRSRWHRLHRPALRAAELACASRAHQLRRHAAEQIRASESVGTAAVPSPHRTGAVAHHRFEPLPRRVETGSLQLHGGVELLSLGAGAKVTIEHLVNGRRRVSVTDHASAGVGVATAASAAGAGAHLRVGPERTRTWTVDADDVPALLVGVLLDETTPGGTTGSIGLAARIADTGLEWIGLDTPLDALGPPPTPDSTELLVRASQGGTVRLGGAEVGGNGSLAVGVRTTAHASSIVVAWSQEEQLTLGGTLAGQLRRRLGMTWTPPAGTQLTGRLECPTTALRPDPPAGQLATLELVGERGREQHTVRAVVDLDAVRAASPAFLLALEQLAAGRTESAITLLGSTTLPADSVAIDVAAGRIEATTIDLPMGTGVASVSPGLEGRVLTRR
jgi:hypothetical protein